MNQPLDIKQIIADDLELQTKMHNTYVSYMVRKGVNPASIMNLGQWQKHFDFPVTNPSELIFRSENPVQRFFGRKTGQFYKWTKGPKGN